MVVPILRTVRFLHVHEYISMEIMNAHRVPTPEGYVASTPEEVEKLYMRYFFHGAYPIVSFGSRVLVSP